MNKIVLAKPVINTPKTINLLKKVLESSFVNEGTQARELEKKIAKILKVKYCLSTTSGTTTLFLALKALGIKNNDEVIVPNITFPATANAVSMAGGKPILVDVNPLNILIDEKALLKKFQKKLSL